MKYQNLVKVWDQTLDLYFPNRNAKFIYFYLLPFVVLGSLMSGVLIVSIQRLLSPVCLIRLGRFTSEHLGHFILEYDWYQISNRRPRKQHTLDLFFFHGAVCNNFLGDLVKSRMCIINKELFLGAYIFNRLLKSKKYQVDLPVRPTDLSFLDSAEINIQFSISQVNTAQETLARLGINRNSKIVCVFVRDAGYNFSQGLNSRNGSSSYRNCNIKNYIPAIDYLSNHGYTVIRMGRNVEKHLLTTSKNIIDYANSDFQNDLLDFYIPSICEFAIVTDSGTMMLPIAFRKPILLTNIPALHGLITTKFLRIFQFKDWINLENRKLSFLEFLSENTLEIANQSDFEHLGISFRENSKLDILNLVKEYLFEIKANEISIVDHNTQLLAKYLSDRCGRSISGKLCSYWLSERPYFLSA